MKFSLLARAYLTRHTRGQSNYIEGTWDIFFEGGGIVSRSRKFLRWFSASLDAVFAVILDREIDFG